MHLSGAFTPEEQVSLRPKTEAFLTFTGILVVLMGLAVVIGWHAHLIAIIQMRPELPPMQYNTAVCFILCGAGFYAQARNWLGPARVLGILAALVGGLTGCEYLFGINFRIDQLLFHPYLTTQTTSPGRMAPVSALCFLQVGVAILLNATGFGGRWRATATGLLGSFVTALCAVALLGFGLQLPGTYGWGQMTRIAPHTAAGLALLGVAILLIAWNEGREEGEETPRWLPASLGLGMLTVTVVLFQALESKQNQEIVHALRASGDDVSHVISVRMESRISSMVRMAQRWAFSGRPSQAEWEDDMKNYSRDFPDFQAIEWIDAGHLIRWIVPYAGNEAKLNADLTQEKRRREAVERAQETHKPAVTRAVELFRGGRGFVVYEPLFIGQKFDGFIAAVLKAQPLFDRFLPATIAAGDSITVYEGDTLLYARNPGPAPAEKDWSVESTIDMHGVKWKVRVWPGPEASAQLKSRLPLLILAGGIVVSILLALTAGLGQTASRRRREMAAVNEELRNAMAELKTLSGLLPICGYCKRIRDDGGYWSQVETYVGKRTDASFSHGICPECAVKAFKSAGLDVPAEVYQAAEEHRYE